VSEVKYGGIYYDEEGKKELAKEHILEFFDENVTGTRQDILTYCLDKNISNRTTDRTLRDMVDEEIIEKIRNGMRISYTLK